MRQNISYWQLLHHNLQNIKKNDQNLSDQQIKAQAKEITDKQWSNKDILSELNIQANYVTPTPKQPIIGQNMQRSQQKQVFKEPEQKILLTSKGPIRKTLKIPTIIKENQQQLQTQRRNQSSNYPEILNKIIAEKDQQLLISKEIIQDQQIQIQENQSQIQKLSQKIEHLEKISQIYYDEISEYYIMDEKILIGQGGFGEVYKVPLIDRSQFRAIKILNKEKLYLQSDRDFILNEIYALKQLDHPNIVQLYDVFEKQNEIILVMEYCEQHLELNGKEDEVRIIMRQVIDAIQYCHQKGIVHKDIKPSNIMLKQKDDFYTVKLIDFGLSQFEIHQYFNDKSGTKSFISPEIIIGKYTKLCDIWSFAVSLYQLLTGFNPFKSNKNMNEQSQTQYKIMKMQIPLYQLRQTKLSGDALDLIQKCLVEEKNRLTAEEVIQHPFFQQIY